ncbi:Immunoglobulin-like domain [Trinorchestia longiramus]|nr:Immunoglobulin-like domain [Trinorchestia longiramus]
MPVLPPLGIRLSPRFPALARYSPGETVERNCSAGGSIPRTELRWTINGSPAMALELVEYPDKVEKDGRTTTTTGIKLITNQHFHRGVARVSCIATINEQKLQTLSEILYADSTATVAYNTHLANAGVGASQRYEVFVFFTSFFLRFWRCTII